MRGRFGKLIKDRIKTRRNFNNRPSYVNKARYQMKTKKRKRYKTFFSLKYYLWQRKIIFRVYCIQFRRPHLAKAILLLGKVPRATKMIEECVRKSHKGELTVVGNTIESIRTGAD